MKTRILKTSSESRRRSIAAAGRMLHQGELVAFPTETVYGLGANIFNRKAVGNIFRVKGGEPLTQGGKILSHKNGEIVTDGPFAESKESVAGYFIVNASSLDEAAEMAREYPDYHLGGKVEVREVMKIETPA